MAEGSKAHSGLLSWEMTESNRKRMATAESGNRSLCQRKLKKTAEVTLFLARIEILGKQNGTRKPCLGGMVGRIVGFGLSRKPSGDARKEQATRPRPSVCGEAYIRPDRGLRIHICLSLMLRSLAEIRAGETTQVVRSE